ncbi:methyltransferase domain-containing protein [Sphaerisporangium album]|uniref:Methyltransferase domain-containing protein n=1 Tax=Sphaerisporangium album TaxID=509200 RepID=A0A367ESF9_9ACTN|nr:methyltransferase domain-containing protein [Sphaerisporangium album]RCG20120.1 methyltransferase domain-containing protein [Sphaerisporangium album]
MTTAQLDPVGSLDCLGEATPVAVRPDTRVRDHYRRKTAAIVDRYGPGPRVHYHLGLFDRPHPPSGATAERVRAGIVAAQERMLERVAEVCEASRFFAGDLLDVGCGLGGGAIYWAERHPVQVTALTNVPEHAGVVASFAAEAELAGRIRPLVADVRELPSSLRFDAAVATESLCHIPRAETFQRVGAALRPGGVFAVEDVFLADPAWREPFDEYWRTRIGTVTEYERAAGRAGLVMDRNVNVTAPTTEFWVQSMAWAQARLSERAVPAEEEQRLVRSIRGHLRFFLGWRDNAYHARILRFRKMG